VYRTHWYSPQHGNAREVSLLTLGKIDAVLSSQIREGGAINRCLCARRTEHQVEILGTIVLEIPHFVVDAEANLAHGNVLEQEWAVPKQVKEERPAGYLRMLIAPRMVLPKIAEPIGYPWH
jgi:hypothetical protein